MVMPYKYPMDDLPRHTLGHEDEPVALSGAEAIRSAATELVSQGKRTLDIYTLNLAKNVYGDSAFVDAVRQLVLDNSRAEVRILVADSASARRAGHRLILLGQELTSKITFKNPAPAFPQPRQPFLLVDGVGLLRLTPGRILEGVVNFNAPAAARELGNAFDRSWEASDPDPYLKRLTI